MQLTREITRLLIGILTLFFIISMAAAYWAVIGADTIYRREDNPRLVEAEARLIRGSIRDRNNQLLATSLAQPNRTQQRHYPHPEISSVVGYASLRYGVGGAEAAYNSILRGDNQSVDFATELGDWLLQRPGTGADIQLTLDLQLQQKVIELMEGQTGAVVLMAVPTGDILALASMPTYDPNTLDQQWENLVSAPDNPFFNRALQGAYQPGGILETPLMAAALARSAPLETRIENATEPVALEDVTVACAVRLPFTDLTLREAYAFACPLPFTQLAAELGSTNLEDLLNTFQLNTPISLPGFPPSLASDNTIVIGDGENTTQTALGQGALTVTPLEVVTMVSAIINDGNAPQPNLLLATAPLGTLDWVRAENVRPTIPYTTARTARQLQDLMREAVALGAASNAGRPNMDIGGHASLAYSGDAVQSWFIGFTTLPAGRSISIAVVLEDTQDPGLAADIGGAALEAARNILSPAS